MVMTAYKINTGRIMATVVVLFLVLPVVLLAVGEKRTKEIPEVESIESKEYSDSLFYELHISPDGIYGLDSNGDKWEYDLNRQQFKSDSKNPTMTVFGRKVDLPDLEFDYRNNIDSIRLELEQALLELDEGIAFYEKEVYDSLKNQLKDIIDVIDYETILRDKELKQYPGLKLGQVIIQEDETVVGSVKAFGEVIVRGNVKGNVISYDRIQVTATGKITGNATAPEIEVLRGGKILGKRLENIPSIKIPNVNIQIKEDSSLPIITILSILVGLLFIGLIGLTAATTPMNRVHACLDKNFFKSCILGLLFWIALAPLFGLLSLTIIGIPVALIALPLATVVGILMAIIAVSRFYGGFMSRLIKISSGSRMVHFVIGLMTLILTWFIWATLVTEPDSTSQGFAVLFLVISIVIWSISISAGVGSVIITRFGTRDCKESLASKFGAGAAPPPPSPPPLRKEF